MTLKLQGHFTALVQRGQTKVHLDDENYLPIGCTWSGNPSSPIPQCVYCAKQRMNAEQIQKN